MDRNGQMFQAGTFAQTDGEIAGRKSLVKGWARLAGDKVDLDERESISRGVIWGRDGQKLKME